MGVDVARAVALIGMMATHVVEAYPVPDGDLSWWHAVFGGRASALFCVLAGVSLSLSTRTAQQPRPGAWRGVLARAVCLIFLGLLLSLVVESVAIILAYYGVLFVCAAAWLKAPTWSLWAAGVGWAVIGPVLSMWWRATAGLKETFGQVDLAMMAQEPVQALQMLLLTGRYPAWTWFAYVLIGMALGRLPLRQSGTHLWLVGCGLLGSGATFLVSQWAMYGAGGLSKATAAGAELLTVGYPVQYLVERGLNGTTPPESAWWLLFAIPHSGSPMVLLHTVCTSMLVLGAVLWCVESWRGAVWPVFPLVAAGSMTLTLYCVHVLVEDHFAFWVQVVGALVVASAWSFTPWRGPLESLLSAVARLATNGRWAR